VESTGCVGSWWRFDTGRVADRGCYRVVNLRMFGGPPFELDAQSFDERDCPRACRLILFHGS